MSELDLAFGDDHSGETVNLDLVMPMQDIQKKGLKATSGISRIWTTWMRLLVVVKLTYRPYHLEFLRLGQQAACRLLLKGPLNLSKKVELRRSLRSSG